MGNFEIKKVQNILATIEIFSQFEFPASTSLCTHENQPLILTTDFLKSHLPDQQKSVI